MDKYCFKCKLILPIDQFGKDRQKKDGLYSYCKSCNSKKASEWCRTNRARAGNNSKKYKKRYPIKRAAQNLIKNLIRSGKLLEEPCEICQTKEDLNAHHDDYSLPLVVRWLCRKHHFAWHAKHGKGKNG